MLTNFTFGNFNIWISCTFLFACVREIRKKIVSNFDELAKGKETVRVCFFFFVFKYFCVDDFFFFVDISHKWEFECVCMCDCVSVCVCVITSIPINIFFQFNFVWDKMKISCQKERKTENEYLWRQILNSSIEEEEE